MEVPAFVRVPGAVVTDASVMIPTDDPTALAATLLAQLGQRARELRGIEIVRPSLESVFLTVTGRRYDPAIETAA